MTTDHRPEKGRSVDPAFRVTRTRTVPIVTYRQEVDVIYEGDDWLEAEEAAHTDVMRNRRDAGHRRFEGHHPTHRLDPMLDRCLECGAPDNGCFKIHAPCGYDTGSKAIITIMAEERARRDQEEARAASPGERA